MNDESCVLPALPALLELLNFSVAQRSKVFGDGNCTQR